MDWNMLTRAYAYNYEEDGGDDGGDDDRQTTQWSTPLNNDCSLAKGERSFGRSVATGWNGMNAGNTKVFWARI